jgi:hypothetical protein
MSAEMSVPAHGLGSPRNGLPPSGNYVYRGTGEDQLTPPRVMMAWGKQVAKAAGGPLRPWAREDVAGGGGGEGRKRPPPPPAPAPQRPPSRQPAPPESPAGRLASLEQDLAARGVVTPEPGPDKPVDYWPAYYPGPGVPGRCENCGYLRTANGHKITCGGEP